MSSKLNWANKKITKKHAEKVQTAFYTKYEEYSKLTLEELRELYNHKDKKIRPGGIYKRALLAVTNEKLRQLREEKLKEQLEENPKQTEEKTEENGSSL